MATTMVPSPLPTRQLFSAGAQPVETRTEPTWIAVPGRQSGNAIDNDCTTINTATYNICDGHNSNLEAALRACEKMRINVGVLTETRLSTDRYTRSAYGYTVFATQTTHVNQGGIALIFTNNSLYFQVESQRKHGPNVISKLCHNNGYTTSPSHRRLHSTRRHDNTGFHLRSSESFCRPTEHPDR
jgi:hypothetical protein